MKITTNIYFRNYLFLTIFLVALFMAGGHLMDIGDIVEDIGLVQGKEAYLTNGFFNVDVDRIYHLGYYMMYVSFFAITLLFISLLVKKDVK